MADKEKDYPVLLPKSQQSQNLFAFTFCSRLLPSYSQAGSSVLYRNTWAFSGQTFKKTTTKFQIHTLQLQKQRPISKWNYWHTL